MPPLNKKRAFSPQFSLPLVEQITEFLTHAIVDGQFEMGGRLVENELQRQFGVSRSPIRESFRILEKKGLVTSIPRKGTYVRKIVQKDIEENFPVRANLESLAARLALPHLTPEDIEKMETAFTRMGEAAQNNNFKSYLKYHSEYHDVFIRASRNDTLIEILDNLRNQAIWFRYSYLYVQESFEYAIQVHRKILDCFIKKDADRLEALVKEHILIALERFIQFLNSQK
ncbi:MAG: GntR family transcriptional regulator [Deltaproteobacteria bacterium]|nr:GntR family transcriptional regulator [Deltaproteobacteria bacterium]